MPTCGFCPEVSATDVALGYLRPADLWRNNVTEGLFGASGAKGGSGGG